MPRKAHLANHYSTQELKKKYLKSTDSVESRRWHLLWKISLGWTIKNSAIAIGIDKELEQKYPEAEIELWFFDEHRIGLSKKAVVPEGITVGFLPPYSPELQPAERLWQLVDEPLVNKYFETIDEIEEILVKRCNTLMEMNEEIKNLTNYYWLAHD